MPIYDKNSEQFKHRGKLAQLDKEDLQRIDH